jgi:hypothetical protein
LITINIDSATAALLFRWTFAKQKNEIIETGSFANIRSPRAPGVVPKDVIWCFDHRQYKQRGSVENITKDVTLQKDDLTGKF